MSLRVWLPLNGDLRNNGLSNVDIVDSNLTVDNNGKIGKCYSFNGSNSKITNTFNTPVSSSIGSLACWVKFNAFPASGKWYTLLQLGNLGGYATCRLGLYMEYTDKICVSVDGSSQKNLYTHSLQINQWYHICTTYDGNIIKLYINGIEVMSTVAVKGSYTTGASYLFMGATNNFWLNGYMNDARYYDHALSAKEVKELSKGLVCHYPLSQAFPIDNLVRNQTYAVYNNYASSGSTGTLVKTGERYNDCDVYRLTYTPNDTSLANVQSTLYSHGVYGFNKKFLANTKYCFWILWRAISHPDTICGGTASNIGGWTEVPTKKFSGEWNIVGQYRNGTVTTDKTDYIFTSFKTPSATSGTPIIIDFCCPHLVEGYDYILEENGYGGDAVTKIYDTSGYNYYGINYNSTINNNSSKYNISTFFDGSNSYIEFDNLDFMANMLPDEWSFSFWVYNQDSGDRSILFSNYGLGGVGGASFGFEKATNELLRVAYNNGTFDKVIPNSTLTVNDWTHIIVTKTKEHLISVYRNGVFIYSYTNDKCNSLGKIYRLGKDSRSDSTMFKGGISDFRIYTTVLSEDDVKELYQVGASIDKNGNMFAYEFKED